MVDVDELIRQAAPGDTRICEVLMAEYCSFVYNLSLTYTNDADEAEDVVQETFIRASLHLDRYQPGTSLKSWLAQIAINLCRDRARRRKFRQKLADTLRHFAQFAAPAMPNPEDRLILNETQRGLRAAIDRLDEKHREPVLLRYQQGLSVPEIAQALNTNVGTIHSRLHYAHKKLREQMGDGVDAGAAAPERTK